jgi:hypothetical protein
VRYLIFVRIARNAICERTLCCGSDQTADGEELIELALPDDDEQDASGKLVRRSDKKLQTRMTPNAVQKRLLDIYCDARTLEEEQGVNILFLGLGTHKWFTLKTYRGVPPCHTRCSETGFLTSERRFNDCE